LVESAADFASSEEDELMGRGHEVLHERMV
jgi:hypothetical protein